jgi:hypothetical protein
MPGSTSASVRAALRALHRRSRGSALLHRLAVGSRVLLCTAFLPTGLVKLLGRPFTRMGPETRILTITEPLRRILSAPGRRLKTLTFVPVSKAPRREQRGLAPGLFKYDRVSLRTYR